jgi:hypothetical protein
VIQLVLSLDYEIFGNGSGDVRRDMIEPTRRLLALCDGYGVQVSIMLEVGEYWAMKEAERAGSLHLDYSPSREIEEQIHNAVHCGHDVQLHLHPWWIGASFQDGNWRLHPEYKRVTDLPNNAGSEGDLFSVVGVLCEGKRTLEALVRPVCPDYECLVYRAAMFWGQPSGELIQGLKKAGLVADSSVISGMHETAPVPTDYRQAASETGYWWTDANDLSRSGRTGEHLIEFPVYARLRPYMCNFKWTKLCATLKRRSQEKSNTHGHGMMDARRSTEPFARVLRRLATRQPLKYDFCKLSAGDMIRGLRRLLSSELVEGNAVDTPVVMLGHSKDFWNDWNLAAFLKFVKEECAGRVRFSTLGECTRRVLERDTRGTKKLVREACSEGVAAPGPSGEIRVHPSERMSPRMPWT